MKRVNKSGFSSTNECRCQRSACLKNYCRCYNANRMCGASCKCLGCKNVPPGTRKVQSPIKSGPADLNEKPFSAALACSITKVLLAKAFQLQSRGATNSEIEEEVLLEFNACFMELVHQLTEGI